MASRLAKFNEQEYEFEMYIDDGNNSSNRFYINPAAIVNLTIEDTLADWVVRGSLTIYNSFESLENKNSSSAANNNADFHFFRNDGNDILHIRIFPKLKNIGFTVDRKHWELVYKFSIYDTEDIENPPGAQNAASANVKCKRFYFHDRWYQKLSTNFMEYSTGLSNSILPNSSTGLGGNLLQNVLRFAFSRQVPNSPVPTGPDRSILTGLAMKEIIEKALTNNNTTSLPYSNVVGGGDQTAWDFGASNLFYTAPATASAYDSLMYVYSRHVSSIWRPGSPTLTFLGQTSPGPVCDFCILYKEKGPSVGNEGYFALRPITNFFERAGKAVPGDFLIERFTVQGSTSSAKKVKLQAGPSNIGQNMQINTTLGPYSTITKYTFVDISPQTNATRFRTTPVCSFDFTTRTYNVDFYNNSVTTARSFMTSNYISKLFRMGNSSADRVSLITLDESKATRNICPVFSQYGNDPLQRQVDGLQNLLKTGLFQNTAINFRAYGATNREPGRFMVVSKTDGVDDTPFNSKFYGQWFIINVRHIFESGVYYNDITAVKLNRLKPLAANLPNTI